MKKLATLAVPLALAIPAAALAQDPPPDNLVVGGHLKKSEAHRFVRKIGLSGHNAARQLLKDERADFYSTGRLKVERTPNCFQFSDSIVDCGYDLHLVADKAHQDKGWFAIRCRGTYRVTRFTNGGTGGDAQDYRCWTLKTKT